MVKTLQLTSTFPPGRFGALNIEGNQIKNFEELDYSYHCESPREGIPNMCARSLGINFEKHRRMEFMICSLN